MRRATNSAGLPRRLRQQNGKLVAAIAERGVYQTQMLAQGSAHHSDQLAAHQVAVLVVHRLEVVKIKKQQGKLVAETCRTVDFLIEHVEEMALVVEPGAIVGDAEFLDTLDRPRVLNRDGGVVSYRLQKKCVPGIDFRIDVH